MIYIIIYDEHFHILRAFTWIHELRAETSAEHMPATKRSASAMMME